MNINAIAYNYGFFNTYPNVIGYNRLNFERDFPLPEDGWHVTVKISFEERRFFIVNLQIRDVWGEATYYIPGSCNMGRYKNYSKRIYLNRKPNGKLNESPTAKLLRILSKYSNDEYCTKLLNIESQE